MWSDTVCVLCFLFTAGSYCLRLLLVGVCADCWALTCRGRTVRSVFALRLSTWGSSWTPGQRRLVCGSYYCLGQVFNADCLSTDTFFYSPFLSSCLLTLAATVIRSLRGWVNKSCFIISLVSQLVGLVIGVGLHFIRCISPLTFVPPFCEYYYHWWSELKRDDL